jgi:hypothetical protein
MPDGILAVVRGVSRRATIDRTPVLAETYGANPLRGLVVVYRLVILTAIDLWVLNRKRMVCEASLSKKPLCIIPTSRRFLDWRVAFNWCPCIGG